VERKAEEVVPAKLKEKLDKASGERSRKKKTLP
jgi:hypothetical protein